MLPFYQELGARSPSCAMCYVQVKHVIVNHESWPWVTEHYSLGRALAAI